VTIGWITIIGWIAINGHYGLVIWQIIQWSSLLRELCMGRTQTRKAEISLGGSSHGSWVVNNPGVSPPFLGSSKVEGRSMANPLQYITILWAKEMWICSRTMRCHFELSTGHRARTCCSCYFWTTWGRIEMRQETQWADGQRVKDIGSPKFHFSSCDCRCSPANFRDPAGKQRMDSDTGSMTWNQSWEHLYAQLYLANEHQW